MGLRDRVGSLLGSSGPRSSFPRPAFLLLRGGFPSYTRTCRTASRPFPSRFLDVIISKMAVFLCLPILVLFFLHISPALAEAEETASRTYFNERSDIPLDENERVESNWLLYTNTPVCETLAHKVWSHNIHNAERELAGISSSLASAFFGNYTDPDGCNLGCLSRGAPEKYMTYLFDDDVFSTADKEFSDALTWLDERCQKCELGFTSHHPNKIFIYWLNTNDERHLVGELIAGESNTQWQHTHLGHRFLAVDSETEEVLGYYMARHNGIVIIGGTGGSGVQPLDVVEDIERLLEFEFDRSRGVQRTFTGLGFDKGRLPNDLWASLSAYYYNNRMSKVREEWNLDRKGLYVNWWQYDAYMIGMPWDLKRYWQRRLKKLVEAWAGVELELTDIYGMRRYEDGARLLTHVDRQSTHAASLIINVAQGVIREPWTVEIYDFADRLHEVVMEEGDIVYYESARCLHGRMRPLQGAFYVNLFAHYRPIGDPDWFKKENPPEATPQILDIGNCTVTGSKPACSAPGVDLPFLSPTLESLDGPSSLFDWWKRVSPPHDYDPSWDAEASSAEPVDMQTLFEREQSQQVGGSDEL